MLIGKKKKGRKDSGENVVCSLLKILNLEERGYTKKGELIMISGMLL